MRWHPIWEGVSAGRTCTHALTMQRIAQTIEQHLPAPCRLGIQPSPMPVRGGVAFCLQRRFCLSHVDNGSVTQPRSCRRSSRRADCSARERVLAGLCLS